MRGSVARLPLVSVLLVAVLASWLPSAHAATDQAPTRLLVTYAAPVDGDTEVARLTGASLADDPGRASAVQVLSFDRAGDAGTAAVRLAARPDVLVVEPDLPIEPAGRIDHVLDVTVDEAEVRPAGVGPAVTDAPDPAVAPTSSWGVENTGQLVGEVAARAGIDVGAAQVWPRTTGRDVVVAVVDTGVDITHPLLTDRIWVNPREVRDGRDSDGNGYVDDVHGWNFVDDSPHVYRGVDADAHGTHVAGIIAASAHAPTGFRSVAPSARIMPLRVISGGAGVTSHAISALRYAEANGADVVNASWGMPHASAALRAALAELEIPVVVAAGNDGAAPGSPVSYPAADGLPNLISVAAVEPTGAMAAFSSRSRTLVDVTAPGALILSAYPEARLAVASGTSQAAPHVTGAIALALQRHGGLDPVHLAEVVRATVRPLAGAAETRSGGIVRAPALLDRLGTRVPACATTERVPFTDVTPGGAHHDAVACMLARGVTKGTSATAYGAADGLTRAQIASLVANALGPSGQLPPAPAVGRFTDLDGNLHRDNIERLARLGIVRAAAGTRYDPDAIVTRAGFAAVVARAAEWVAGAEVRATAVPFGDTAGHAEVDAISKAAGLVIVTGRAPGVFDPDVPLRRDQAASMVARLLDRLVQQGLLPAV